MSPPRYRFAEFVLSPAQRRLLRGGAEVRLIPRYFELLLLLLERRGEAIERGELLDTAWSDVVVSDNALNQAIRSLRRALGDDPRTPRYIETLPRHGYRFVAAEVQEEPDEGPLRDEERRGPERLPGQTEAAEPTVDPFESELARLLDIESSHSEGDDLAERRDAAEQLHRLGTAETLRRLGERPHHESARAILRDARWDVPEAGPVPLVGEPGGLRAGLELIRLRASLTLRLGARRWAGATWGGALAGLLAGFAGGALLFLGPGSQATASVLVALPLFGLVVGGLGAAGVGGGLSLAEILFRSWRRIALPLSGALGGALVGGLTHAAGSLTLESFFGRDLSTMAGAFEGLVIGGTVGLGYALTTHPPEGGMATPHGGSRLRSVLLAGLLCAAATASLAWSGSFLGAMSLDLLGESFPDSQVSLAPLARLLGEDGPGPRSRLLVSAWEGLAFGAGTTLGLTRRPTG